MEKLPTTLDTINGQYQPLANDVSVRFAGDTADTATLNDKWGK